MSTRPLDAQLIKEAALMGVSIECQSFIETQPIVSQDQQLLIKELARTPLTVVITSMNAVEAIKDHTGTEINWEIYSIGNTTRQLIESVWGTGKVKGTAENASALADVIIYRGVKEVVFFCGEQRREELPLKLKEQGISIKEMVVYRTIETAKPVSKKYDGVLFFSPSAVNSFFSYNQPASCGVAFAIGSTTASALKAKGCDSIVSADTPGKEDLVKKMLAYFRF
ncbi:uroporphyrinogen-III synthase [Chitinophagaceae bacterium LB-8]|uniref:Uroporphyrinogen-III synthase n=1 Tax=Paraflavisolibacter caeni TaxID=2982496 RepID=A0A9X2XU19_9BACT|nr:uroporphyrinogen-III synthase [Paraflavisolibacter caeni]MCU7547653.1 uroporphyrinogen-III synthase [Paraflavisolibacter caeni]